MLTQTVAGITFPNPVGLAAGFDKNGMLIGILDDVGFGFEEMGSITYQSYEGNPKPRLYRLPRSRGLVVYYGLKNDGVDAIMNRVKKIARHDFPLSVSIAKTNCHATGTTEGGVADYVACMKLVQKAAVGDLYVLNISCPNTFGGEPFSTPDALKHLLQEISTLNLQKPLFLKMPSDRPWNEFQGLLDVALQHGVTGVIICNLNKNRSNAAILDPIPENVKGSISGKPVWDISNDLISRTYQHCGTKLVIIGVGGIFSAEDAFEKIKRGATLVQLITGMIFQGPQLIGDINRGLVTLAQQAGYHHISEAIGAHHRGA